MKLTKKEISKNLTTIRRNGFGNGFDYSGTIRGFNFETLTDHPAGELMECDNTGHLTYVATVSEKKEAINAIYGWFKEYASQEFDN